MTVQSLLFLLYFPPTSEFLPSPFRDAVCHFTRLLIALESHDTDVTPDDLKISQELEAAVRDVSFCTEWCGVVRCGVVWRVVWCGAVC